MKREMEKRAARDEEGFKRNKKEEPRKESDGKNREVEEERGGEGVIQISLLVVGWWDKKRNDDIAVKIWRDDWAGCGELDGDV